MKQKEKDDNEESKSDERFKVPNMKVNNFKKRPGSTLKPVDDAKDGFKVVSLNGNVIFHTVGKNRKTRHDSKT